MLRQCEWILPGVCRQQIARPHQNCVVFKINLSGFNSLNQNVRMVACHQWGDSRVWEQITLPKSTLSKLKYFVLLLTLIGPLQKLKCFSEISRYPTNCFSGIVTWKSIPKLGICLSCGWTQTCVVSVEVINFETKIRTTTQGLSCQNPLLCLMHTYILLCAYVLSKKSAHWHNICVRTLWTLYVWS